MIIPCNNCLCLPICKNKVKHKVRYDLPLQFSVVALGRDCLLIRKYIESVLNNDYGEIYYNIHFKFNEEYRIYGMLSDESKPNIFSFFR